MEVMDRMVRTVNSPDAQISGVFSEFLSIKNIILLGDAGSGKSRLFCDFSDKEGALLLTARSFLRRDIESLEGVKYLFVDALDESRVDRKDISKVDLIIEKLMRLKPEYFRLACRTSDWLGHSDWCAFKDYFDGSGNSITLHLEPLSRDQQIRVLIKQQQMAPESFLSGAEKRGLADLLGSPQNLIMLNEVVKGGDWPATRFELFEKSTLRLLDEHSEEQQFRCFGRYSAQELLEPAGELFAVLLLGDISAIAISEKDLAEDIPSYRNISSGAAERVAAVLGRRIFISGTINGTVEYAHRTLAEFLAARWLASKVKEGLPLGRLQSLLCAAGQPTSELRGLHGWLTVYLEDAHARLLIGSDPWGALIYGDGAKLSPSLRNVLLKSLVELADKEPWFYQETKALALIGGLSAEDTIESFEAILLNEYASPSLKAVVLDSLVQGSQSYDFIASCLASLVLSAKEHSDVRVRAIIALLNIPEKGCKIIEEIYSRLGSTTSDIIVRINCLKRLVGSEFVVGRVLELLRDIHYSSIGVYCWELWGIAELVENERIHFSLNWLVGAMELAPVHHNRVFASDVQNEFDRLLIRALKNSVAAEGESLLRWLLFREKQTAAGKGVQGEEIKKIFLSRPDLQMNLVDVCISAVEPATGVGLWLTTVRRLFCGGLTDEVLLARLEITSSLNVNGGRSVVLYQLQLAVALQAGIAARTTFERLYDLAEGNNQWCEARDNLCTSLLSWKDQVKRGQKIAAEKKTITNQVAVSEQLFARKNDVESAVDVDMLADLAEFYFNRKGVANQAVASDELLTSVFSEKGAASIRLGLLNFLETAEGATIENLLSEYDKSENLRKWDVFLAAVDHYHKTHGSILGLGEAQLKMALVMEGLNPVYEHFVKSKRQYVPQWREEISRQKPLLVKQVYLAVARTQLERNYVDSTMLELLLGTEVLAPYKVEAVAIYLGKFCYLNIAQLRKLLAAVLFVDSDFSVAGWVEGILPSQSKKSEFYVPLLAAGLLCSAEGVSELVTDLDDAGAKSLVWEFKGLVGVKVLTATQIININSVAIEAILSIIFRLYGKVPYPKHLHREGATAIDATGYALHLISYLSKTTCHEVVAVLQRLLEGVDAREYRKELLQALANQNKIKADKDFQQVDWRGVVNCLRQTAPANIRDFQVLVVDMLSEFKVHISSANTDMYKRFWNETAAGKLDSPKNEESCRDYLVELLRRRLSNMYFTVEPEGHMANDKRADVVIKSTVGKVVLELKRDCHPKLEQSIGEQLVRLYTRDPESRGYGIFVVFWFGKGSGKKVKKIKGFELPETATEMEQQLGAVIAREGLELIKAVVLDVSGEISARPGKAIL